MPSSKKLISPLSTVLFIAAIFAVYASPAGAATTCKPASNIEAIIDDSGSMGVTDRDANRSEAIKLLISKSGNSGKTLGAVEFGSDQSYLTPPIGAAVTLFGPLPIGANAVAMNTALTNSLKADNGATDYNAAFSLGKTDNPSADARIFITDGGHNSGEYTNGHQGGPPTYVLGLGIGPASATNLDATRLETIAKETGGTYYPDVNTGNIAATVNKVDAALNCQQVAKTFTDTFNKVGQTKSKVVAIGSNTPSADLTLTWASPLDQFSISSISLKTASGATISIAKKRLKIKRSSGKTFVNANIKGLKRGKLRFKLKVKKLGSNTLAGVNLTTQAIPRRR
ncbi:MAG: VWA domain-containing protein [Thermoleophilaceae bacterium]|nr:VWA domain-containing protein [Thermoleophilaceae bacterium]